MKKLVLCSEKRCITLGRCKYFPNFFVLLLWPVSWSWPGQMICNHSFSKKCKIEEKLFCEKHFLWFCTLKIQQSSFFFLKWHKHSKYDSKHFIFIRMLNPWLFSLICNFFVPLSPESRTYFFKYLQRPYFAIFGTFLYFFEIIDIIFKMV